MLRLHFHILRTPSVARLQLVRRFLIRRVQRPPHFPPQTAPLTGLVLRELARHVVEFGARAQFRQGFFFLGMFLTLGVDCQLVICTCYYEREVGGAGGKKEGCVPVCDGC